MIINFATSLLLVLNALFSYVKTVPLYSLDDFEKDANRIDDSTFESTGIFDTLWRIESSPDYIRSLRASLMKNLMDTTVDPCEDFYQFACGNWEKNFPIPEDKAENNVYGLLNNNIIVALKDLLAFDANSEKAEGKNDAIEKAKIYYASCIDEKTRNDRGATPLLDLLNEFGGWPVLNSNWNNEEFDWTDLIAKVAHINFGIFIETSVDADFRDSSSTAIHISEASLVLESKDEYVPGGAYHTLIEEVFNLFNISEETARQTAIEILNLEMKLANATPKEILRANFSEAYASLTLEELIDLYPKIRWQRYLHIVYGVPIELNHTIVASITTYFDVLPDILAETDKKTLANYIGWRIVYNFIDLLDDTFAEARHKLDHALTGQKIAQPHWKKCVRETNELLGMAVGALFVRSYFDEASKKDLEILSDEIRETFIESLEGMEWLDPVTKQAAEMKANLTGIAVGYPDDILIPEKLNKIYENLHVKKDTHFENAINAVRNEKMQINKRLSEKYNKNFWGMSPAIVNAYFEQTQNRIVVPAAALQPPLYYRHFPKFLNYGGMGYFIGHEFTHGFDVVGREFNFAGNMVEWWSEESIQAFEEKTKCFTAQYSNYTMHGKTLEGFLSRAENIADNGGVRQAYYAYKKWLQKHANSDEEMLKESLDGFNLSNTQMFFLQFAQGWCGSIRPEAIENMLITDFHCPGKYRVIGSLTNFNEFAEEFNCPVGSPMNPLNKCRMW